MAEDNVGCGRGGMRSQSYLPQQSQRGGAWHKWTGAGRVADDSRRTRAERIVTKVNE